MQRPAGCGPSGQRNIDSLLIPFCGCFEFLDGFFTGGVKQIFYLICFFAGYRSLFGRKFGNVP
jgi:hypothetical protein